MDLDKKLRRVDGLTPEEIRQLAEWVSEQVQSLGGIDQLVAYAAQLPRCGECEGIASDGDYLCSRCRAKLRLDE